MDNEITVLRERRNWLTARIGAKEKVQWETQWDTRERNALAWAVRVLSHPVIKLVIRVLGMG